MAMIVINKLKILFVSERVVAEVIQEQIMSEIHASGSRRCRGQAIPVFIRGLTLSDGRFDLI